MTETSRFWNGITTGDATAAPYDAPTEFANVMMAVTQSDAMTNKGGVFLDDLNDLSISSTGANNQRISTGHAMSYGNWYSNDGNVDITVPTPAASTRIDRIVLRKDWTAQTVRIVRIAGVEGGAAPALVQSIGVTWDVPLYQVSITTGGVMTVTDQRTIINGMYGAGIRALAAGNIIGVGVTPSAWSGYAAVLQVGQWSVSASSSVGYANLSANSYNDGSWRAIATGVASQIRHQAVASAALVIALAPSVTAGSVQTFTDYFQMAANGTVHFGAASAAIDYVGLRYAGTPNTSGAASYGVTSFPTFSSGATTSGIALYAGVATVASAFTMATAYGLYIANPTKGAGSAITINYGLYVAVQNSGATQNMGMYLEAPTSGSQYNNTIHLNGIPSGGSTTNDVIYHGNTGAKLTGTGTWTSVSNEFLKSGERWKTRVDAATELFTGTLGPKSTILDTLAAIEINWYEIASKDVDPKDKYLRIGPFAERLHAISPALSSDGHGVDGVSLASFAIAALQSVYQSVGDRLDRLEAVVREKLA